jgi:hypothetical protein
MPTLPNSLENLLLDNCNFQGEFNYTLPTNLKVLKVGRVNQTPGQDNSITAFTSTLTTCTGLTTVNLSNNRIQSWTKQFPRSIRTLDFSNGNGAFNINWLNNLDIDLLSGVTSLNLANQRRASGNPPTSILKIDNLHKNNTIETLTVNLCKFDPALGVDALTTSNFPPTLKTFTCNQINVPPSNSTTGAATAGSLFPFSNWNKSFAGCSGLTAIDLRNNGMTQTAVDFIICNIKDLANTHNILIGNLQLQNDAQTNYPLTNNAAPSGPQSTVGTGLWCKAQLQTPPYNWQVNHA